MTRLLGLCALALLAGCGSQSAKDSRTASGEVLQGTISDAMLPLDTVQSEAPAMKAAPKEGAVPAEKAATDAATPDAQAAAAPAAPAPPASPAPAAVPKPGFGN